jgi:hypothetical protein
MKSSGMCSVQKKDITESWTKSSIGMQVNLTHISHLLSTQDTQSMIRKRQDFKFPEKYIPSRVASSTLQFGFARIKSIAKTRERNSTKRTPISSFFSIVNNIPQFPFLHFHPVNRRKRKIEQRRSKTQSRCTLQSKREKRRPM